MGQGNTIQFVGSLIFFQDFLFVLVCLFGQMESMDVTSVLQEADAKCELNITSILTLSHPLHCLICSKDIMIIVLLLQVLGDGKVDGWFIYVRVSVGDRGGDHIFLFCVLFLCC